MTKTELVDAYVRGDLDRRSFIARLTGLGVSVGAAVAYATSLAPATSAAPGASPIRNSAGYIARAQNADGEYGTAIILSSDAEGIQDLLVALSAVDAVLASLDSFSADDFTGAGFSEDDYNLIQTINDQHQQHVNALAALAGSSGAASPGPKSVSYTSVQEFLTALADALNTLTGVFAAVIPALQDGQIRQTVTEIGLVVARQAALVSSLAGEDPLPNTFEPVIDPSTL